MKRFITMLLCFTLICSLNACGGKKEKPVSLEEYTTQETAKEEKTTEISQETEEVSQDTTKEEKEEAPVSETEGLQPNTFQMFSGSDYVADIKMGACINGEQKALCTVTLPTNYYISALTMDEKGEQHHMDEMYGSILSDVIADKKLETAEKFAYSVAMVAEGEIDNHINLAIYPAKDGLLGEQPGVSYDSIKESYKDGKEIMSDDGHRMYIFTSSIGLVNEEGLTCFYEINEDLCLGITSTKPLRDNMSMEEYANECQKVISCNTENEEK